MVKVIITSQLEINQRYTMIELINATLRQLSHETVRLLLPLGTRTITVVVLRGRES
ncbi:hypothetical protein WN48_06419 [Eufriesea mexicana]|uniref:Uncharacterized protein n=1 Tax=Eufriesea mexicana TaxID=516756 RepID=A0A310SC18_9HYME|nr:hypothetical protein WN48_06419 [Eufriesea mexicana]